MIKNLPEYLPYDDYILVRDYDQYQIDTAEYKTRVYKTTTKEITDGEILLEDGTSLVFCTKYLKRYKKKVVFCVDSNGKTYSLRSYKYWREMGEYFGYPKCCVDNFCSANLVKSTVSGHGFVPCPICSNKIKNLMESGSSHLDALKSLIYNRKHIKDFPHDHFDNQERV